MDRCAGTLASELCTKAMSPKARVVNDAKKRGRRGLPRETCSGGRQQHIAVNERQTLFELLGNDAARIGSTARRSTGSDAASEVDVSFADGPPRPTLRNAYFRIFLLLL